MIPVRTAPAPVPMSLPKPGSTHQLSRRPRFLSEADCQDIMERLTRYTQGGGETIISIHSTWRGNVRWARNQISTSGEDQNDQLIVTRLINGARSNGVQLNETSDVALVAALRRAERLALLQPTQYPETDLIERYQPETPVPDPHLFSEATYQMDADHRAAAAIHLAQAATTAGMLSAGYIEVSAHGLAQLTSWGLTRYVAYTWAQYSVTVRDPTGTGSGWAGVDWPDWTKIDGRQLSALALEKCLTSRNPVAIEPGRYTTILEPQAVCDFMGQLVFGGALDRGGVNAGGNENYRDAVFNKTPRTQDQLGYSRLGERVVDERITISADPMDPDLGFPPFDPFPNAADTAEIEIPVYHAATWIDHGVLTNLAYDREYARVRLRKSTGLPNSGAFRMLGGSTAMAEMIATTKRGLLVTRFDHVLGLEDKALLYRGYTRDGLWLIEDGKISKAVKNMAFTESILFALNNVEQLGVPQRVFHPPGYALWSYPQPVIVPPLKIRDFSFTALVDAI